LAGIHNILAAEAIDARPICFPHRVMAPESVESRWGPAMSTSKLLTVDSASDYVRAYFEGYGEKVEILGASAQADEAFPLIDVLFRLQGDDEVACCFSVWIARARRGVPRLFGEW